MKIKKYKIGKIYSSIDDFGVKEGKLIKFECCRYRGCGSKDYPCRNCQGRLVFENAEHLQCGYCSEYGDAGYK